MLLLLQVMGYSDDGFPYVGDVPDRPGQYICAGFNGHGMPAVYLSALGIAKMVRDGTEFEGTGVPRMFKTTQERLDKISKGPAGGDIIGKSL